MKAVVPAKRPLVPIKKIGPLPVTRPGPEWTYEAVCKVPGCGWTKQFPVRASLQYSVDEHKRHHVNAWVEGER